MLLYMSRLKFARILILNLPIDNGLKESFLFSNFVHHKCKILSLDH